MCFKTLLIEPSCSEAFARVSKKGMQVILPIPSAPNGLLRAHYENISEVNRTVVPQTDSKSIFPQKFKKNPSKQASKQPANQEKTKQDEWFFKRERAIPAPQCHKQHKPAGQLESRNKHWEHAWQATVVRTEPQLFEALENEW